MASFLFFPKDFYRVSLRENHGFCLQQLYIFIPQRISCLFKREPRILPSTALHLHSLVDIVFLRERSTDFAFNGFTLFIPQGISCLFEREPQILPPMALHFHSPVDIVSLRTTDFSLSDFIFSFLKGFISCLFLRELRILPSVALFIFIPQRIYTVSP